MSNSKQISVMISSRCNDPIVFEEEEKTLSDLRRKIKEELESIEILDGTIFDVWINEDAPPDEASQDAWEHCMEQVRKANIVLVLYNGNSGWAKESGGIGICHAELQAGLEHSPAKLRLIKINNEKLEDGVLNERFKEYVECQNLFRGQAVNTGEELITQCKKTLREAVVDMVRLGVTEARKGKYYTGAALEWNRLDFHNRKQVMEKTLSSNLKARQGATDKKSVGVFVPFEEDKVVLIRCHAIPDSMSVSAARELVGQPFLLDHQYSQDLGDNYIGVVHLIACYGRVTEAQTRKFIGYPDVMIVCPPFGVYAVEHIYKSQVILVSNCRDDTSTRNGVQRFFDWLEQSGERKNLLARAMARTEIVKKIAEVIDC